MFIGLGKMKMKPSEGSFDRATKMIDDLKDKGIKIIGWYITLGRYDVVLIYEAKNEKEALKTSFEAAEFLATETLVAIPRGEVREII